MLPGITFLRHTLDGLTNQKSAADVLGRVKIFPPVRGLWSLNAILLYCEVCLCTS